MTTVADLVEQTFDHLYSQSRQQFNVLDGALTTTGATVTFEHAPSDVTRGSYLSIDDELMYVISVDQSAKTAVVLRGQRGTRKAVHADGALVDINPRFPRYLVKRALRDEVRSWPSSVYRIDTLDLSASDGVAGYDLIGVGDDFYSIIDLQYGPAAGSVAVDVTRTAYTIYREGDPVTFPSGAGVVLTGVAPSDARDVRVVLALPFDTTVWENTTDLVDDVGLAESMLDIPPIGAAWRLMSGRDIKRSFGEGQGESRRAEEVPAGFAGSIATFHKRTRDARLSDEAVKLLGRHPMRML